MSDPRYIDSALIATLLNDATLMALAVDGVYYSVAAQSATRFVLIDRLSALTEGQLADLRDSHSTSLALIDCLYLVKYVEKGTSSLNALTAAARIQTLLQDQPLSDTPASSPAGGVTGWTWMSTSLEEAVRIVEADQVDPSIYWQHAGGHYRIQMSTA